MIKFSDWTETRGRQTASWLLIGEGPTFAGLTDIDRSQWTTVGLNYVFRRTHVDLAIVLDAEAVDSCSVSDFQNVGTLLMPTEPFVHGRPSSITLDELVQAVPALQTLADEGRIVAFDRADLEACSGGFDKQRPAIDERIACELIAKLAADDIATLGCDETADIHDEFRTFRPSRSLLVDPHRTRKQRDHQRRHLASIAMNRRPLAQPFRVYINADESQMLAAAVLARGIRDFATTPVAITILKNPPLPRVRNPQCWPRNPRALTRFLVPELAGFQGRALFLEADMLIRGDVAELVSLALDRCQVAVLQNPKSSGWEPSLQVINCQRADWQIERIMQGLDEGRYTSDELIGSLANVQDSNEIAEQIPTAWQPIYDQPSAATQVHRFRDPKHQPWRQEFENSPAWAEIFRRAIAMGDVTVDDVYDAVEDGYADDSLLTAFSDDEMELFRARRRFPMPERPQGPRLVALTRRAYAFAGRSARNPMGAVRRLIHGSW